MSSFHDDFSLNLANTDPRYQGEQVGERLVSRTSFLRRFVTKGCQQWRLGTRLGHYQRERRGEWDWDGRFEKNHQQ